MEDVKINITSNLVWKEFELAFCYAKFIRIYTDKRRKWNRWANWIVITLVCATSFSFLFDGYLSVIFSVVSSVAIIVREVSPAFKQSEYELSSLDKSADFFAEYQIDMEQIYLELMFGYTTPDICYKHFFELKTRSANYFSNVNKFYRGVSNKEEISVKKELDNYATRFENNESK